MRAVILAEGFNTGISEETSVRLKPMIESGISFADGQRQQ